MGTDAFVGLYSEQHTAAKEYAALVHRLIAQSEVVRIQRWGWISSKGSSTFVADDFMSKFSDIGAEAVAEEVLYSDKWLSTRLIYTLRSGRAIPLDINLFGYKYEGGSRVRTDGFIQVSIALNDLIRPLIATKETSKSSPYMVSEELVILMHDEEELLFRCIGIDNQGARQSNFSHVSAYLETRWPSPVGCSFVYHQTVTEFAADFVRIYQELRQRTEIVATMSPDANILAVCSQGKPSPIHKPTYTYWQYLADDHDKEALLSFLAELDEKKVWKLASMNAHEIKEALLLAGENLPDVVCYDLGNAGMAIASPPYLSVWTAYQFVADRVS